LKYYIIAGEASGDLHGSELMKALLHEDSQAEFRFWGGDLMEKVGGKAFRHIRELAFMGFIEVVKNLPAILKNLKSCKTDIVSFNPDAIIFIDYPGFNLKIAEWARKAGYPTIYFISPQIWAWKEKRVFQIKRDIQKMIVILPFEKSFYAKFGVEVEYVGHPLVEILKNVPKEPINDKVALLPGSRKQEIDKVLPEMLKAAKKFENLEFTVCAAPAIPFNYYERFDFGTNVKLHHGSSYEVLSHSSAAVVSSGTATLETALLGVPQVVVFKGNRLTYLIAKKLIRVKYIALVNLIADKEIVKELIQNDCNEIKIAEELKNILNLNVSKHIKNQYLEVKSTLGQGGAISKTAQIIQNFLRHNG
jgi:lipid-A-disaccharide synthase